MHSFNNHHKNRINGFRVRKTKSNLDKNTGSTSSSTFININTSSFSSLKPNYSYFISPMFCPISTLLWVPVSIVCLIFLLRLFLHRSALIHVVRKWFGWVEDKVHVHQHFKVPEFNEQTHHQQNQLYHRVLLYLNSLQFALEDSDFTNILSGKNPNDIVLSLDDNQEIRDTFLGARVSWINRIDHESRRSFVLKIKKKDKRRILNPYLQHIHTVSDDIEQRGKRELKIYYNTGDGKWKHASFDHPACFDALVMDADLKSRIKSDLETFSKSRQYYHKLGRVWKRSYLLYGPSGTGKSSFIAASANLLNYDVYNLNLSQVVDDAQLSTLSLQIAGKSIIVVEDLDRQLSEEKNNNKFTLSGLLNFMDGILNLQDERIMNFTMNSKDGISDSALLRPGRIDMHICFPLCGFKSFKDLASNYLGVKEHKLFPKVEEIFQTGATMSQSEIGELMLVNRSSPSRALKSVISALQSNARHRETKTATRMSESVSSSPSMPIPSEEDGDGDWKGAVPKEFRKLYGLLRLKSCRRPGSFDRDNDIIQR